MEEGDRKEKRQGEGEGRNEYHFHTNLVLQTYILESPRKVSIDINSSARCSCVLVAILPPQSIVLPSVLLYRQKEEKSLKQQNKPKTHPIYSTQYGRFLVPI